MIIFLVGSCDIRDPKFLLLNQNLTTGMFLWWFTSFVQVESLELFRQFCKTKTISLLQLIQNKELFAKFWLNWIELGIWNYFNLIPGKDSCSGDSGGPLVAQVEGDFKQPKYLVGIVSFGTSKCAQGIPGVYTSIDYYLPWILENMKP